MKSIVLLMKQTSNPSPGKEMWDVGNCCAPALVEIHKCLYGE